MPAAVRVGDITTHGGTVAGPGCQTVLIGGMPAAVASDNHACVLLSPHPPCTPFPVGSLTVMIGGKPALRTSDICGCGAMAVVGCLTVNIG
jgi:uncharacterized Zn-binding protein involved in type VI secretion